MKENTKASNALNKIFSLIKENGPVSQKTLCSLSGYSRSTVSINCEKLLNSKLIKPVKDADISVKRKNFQLVVNGKVGCIAGIGMGATNCRISIFDINLEEHSFEVFKNDFSLGPLPILNKIILIIKRLVGEKKLFGVGMGLPAPVDYKKGCVLNPINMIGWHGFPIKDFVQKELNCPVFIDNEASTMGLFEATKANKSTVIAIKAGTGIGGALIKDKRIFRGKNGSIGNIGHIPVLGCSNICKCGRIGCLETIAGANSMVEKAKQFIEDNNDVSLERIKKLSEEGNVNFLNIIKDSANAIGTILGPIVSFIDPDVVIINGKTKCFGPIFIDLVRSKINSYLLPGVPSAEVRYGNYQNSSTFGSGIMCLQELLEDGTFVENI